MHICHFCQLAQVSCPVQHRISQRFLSWALIATPAVNPAPRCWRFAVADRLSAQPAEIIDNIMNVA
jgi:hypothetical protein